ncbi:unnamed protein product [Rhizophagus irregularis]|nr:unnamed protein product [Rhizophagus irregularis]
MNENNKNLVDNNQAPTSDNVVAKEIYQTAERNKKICEDILNRVQVAEASVRNLKDRKEFFTEENYIKLYRLVNIIRKMRQFLVEITQLKGLKKYIHSKAIQEIFNNLVNEFEATIRILQVSISLDSSTSAEELTLSTVCAGREAASKVEIPFADFLQLIDEVTKLYNEIVEIYQKAEHNKRICEAMLNRVKIADTALKNLRIRNLDFFSKKNYDNFRNLVIIIKEIRQFLIEITKSSGFEKLTGTSSINENFSNLIDKFETAIKPLQFSLIIYFNADDYKKVKTDVKDLTAEEWIKKKMKEEDIKYFEDLHSKNILVNNERDMLGYHISHENLREEPIDGTPSEYRQLYQKCWDGDPEKRPNINEVYNEILRQYANDANEQQEDPLAASISDNLNSLYKQSGQLGLCIETCSIDCNRQ